MRVFASASIWSASAWVCSPEVTSASRWAFNSATRASTTFDGSMPLPLATSARLFPPWRAARSSSAVMPRALAAASRFPKPGPPRPGPWPGPWSGRAAVRAARTASSSAWVIVPFLTSGSRAALAQSAPALGGTLRGPSDEPWSSLRNPGGRRSGGLDVEVDGGDVAVAALRRREQVGPGEDPVGGVGRVLAGVGGVGPGGVHGPGHGLVEEQLGGDHLAVADVDLDVDVDGPPPVPAGVDRHELGDAVGAGELRSPQVALGVGRGAAAPTSAGAATRPVGAGRLGLEPGVDPGGVAVPDVDDGVGPGRAVGEVPHPDGQRQRRALAVLTDVAADLLDVDVVGPLGELRHHGARTGPVQPRRGSGAGGPGSAAARVGRAVLAAGGEQGTEAQPAQPGESLPSVDGTPPRSRGRVRVLGHALSLAAGPPPQLRRSSEFAPKSGGNTLARDAGAPKAY